ncbi:MAG: hypothetical protein QXS10_05845 [Candidatus Bathyarchaeia archaeon]
MLGGKGISSIISMVVITATLLIILIVASFFATNMLEIQVQNSEFEQAKTAMQLLDKTIMDVSLRRGAASSVQFNQRSGGIGLYEGNPLNIRIIDNLTSEILWNATVNPSYVIKYRGGSMASAAEVNLTSSSELIIKDPSKSMGYVRTEVNNGVWVVLDYNRVRVIENSSLKTIEIYLIRLARSERFGGSGTVTVRVQNKAINPLFSGSLNNNATLYVQVSGLSIPPASYSLQEGFIVRVMETLIEVSIV